MYNVTKFLGININGHADIEFIDIPVDTDALAYIDPERIAYCCNFIHDPLSVEAHRNVTSFFGEACSAVKSDDYERFRYLFEQAHEPNETRLGHSGNRPCGRGVTPYMMEPFYERAYEILHDCRNCISGISDLSIFIPRFGEDRLSDLCTNIIREQLVSFTWSQLEYWGKKPCSRAVNFHVWNRYNCRWDNRIFNVPIIYGLPTLLCPKRYVGTKMLVNPDKLLSQYVLEYRQRELLEARSPLCGYKLRKDGAEERTKPTKKEIWHFEVRGVGRKEYLKREVTRNPGLLYRYRENSISTRDERNIFMSDEELDQLLYCPDKMVNNF